MPWQLWQIRLRLLSLPTTCGITRMFANCKLQELQHSISSSLFMYLGPCQICIAVDPSDVHCPGDEVLQRHGSKAGGQKISWRDVRATHLPSISIPVLFTSNDACGIVLFCSPAGSFGAKVAWIQMVDYFWMCCEAVYFVEACGITGQRGLTESTLEVFSNECKA